MTRGTHVKQSLDPVDEYIGNRVRMRREMLAMSQQKLGAALGVSRQQIQKYEKGANRISAGRMIQFAEKAWRGPGIFRRRLQRWFEGQWPYLPRSKK